MPNFLETCVPMATALTLASLAGASPAKADCVVGGIAYSVIDKQAGDPTGPSLYIETSPGAGFYYFVRLRDGAILRKIIAEPWPIHVLLRGDAHRCPTEGRIRDAGTVIGEPRLQTLAADSGTAD